MGFFISGCQYGDDLTEHVLHFLFGSYWSYQQFDCDHLGLRVWRCWKTAEISPEGVCWNKSEGQKKATGTCLLGKIHVHSWNLRSIGKITMAPFPKIQFVDIHVEFPKESKLPTNLKQVNSNAANSGCCLPKSHLSSTPKILVICCIQEIVLPTYIMAYNED